jgi:hypothetical protein
MKILALTFLTIVSASATAQSFVGFMAGMNRTDMYDSDTRASTKAATGFTGGITIERFLNARYSIGVGLTYVQRGFKNSAVEYVDPQAGTTIKFDYRVRYDYASMPIRASIHAGKKIDVFATLGIIPAVLLDRKLVIKNVQNGNQSIKGYTMEITRATKVDVAALLEAGINFPLTKKHTLFCVGGIQRSLTSMTTGQSITGSGLRHYAAGVSGGLRIKVRK